MAGGKTTLPSWASGSGGGGQSTAKNGTSLPSWAVQTSAPSKGKGGFLGALGSVGKTIDKAAHWTAQKSELAGHDLLAMPVGLAHQAIIGLPIERALLGGQLPSHAELKAFLGAEKQQASGVKATVQHPLRDPFQTALLAGAAFSGGASIAGRGVEAANAARAGMSAEDVLKAAVKRPPIRPRGLTINNEKVPLKTSRSQGMRTLQKAHDAAAQLALDKKPEGRVASYAKGRVGGSLKETARIHARLRNVPATLLDEAAKRLAPVRGRVPGTTANRYQRVEQAAMELTSTNTMPEEAALYHEGQAAKGVNPELNWAVARLYRRVGKEGMVTLNHGQVTVDAVAHPSLAMADARLAQVQRGGDEVLKRYGVRTPEELQAAIDKPAKFRAGGVYSEGWKPAVAPEVGARVRKLGQRASGKVAAVQGDNAIVYYPRFNRSETVPFSALEEKGSPGVVGGEKARAGRGHVSYASEAKRAPGGAAAASSSEVVGAAKPPITAAVNTGKNIAEGKVPNNITGAASQHFRQIQRFVNTSEMRNLAVKLGSKTRQTERDVLVRVPGEKQDPIPAAINEVLGRSKITNDDVVAINAALDAYKQQLVPGLADAFKREKNLSELPVGTDADLAAEHLGHQAPGGMVWVDRKLLGDVAKPGRTIRGPVTRAVDNVNSAITAATVYFKIGHLGTRFLTNASANLMQGSLEPTAMGRAWNLFHAVSHEDQQRWLAATGQHGFDSMPHQGMGVTAKVAGAGARWWARHADAPFRINSLAYEMRKEGIRTPAQVHSFLDDLGNSQNLSFERRAQIENIAKASNREAIAYDRLNDFEKRFLSRAIWFYPWIRGASNFLANSLAEHPFKMAVMGQFGLAGRDWQQQQLGDLSTYLGGLIPLTSAQGGRPLVSDFSTFSPYATPGGLLGLPLNGSPVENLNPVYGALLQMGLRQDQYGMHTNHPVSAALSTLFSPTPEAQILGAYLHPAGPTHTFHTTPLSALERSLGGPAVPRRINLAAGHKQAARQRTGR